MQKITNFSDVETVLQDYIRPAPEPGTYQLDRIIRLLDFLGNPQEKLRVIHVAGTSGKTSTCYYLAALLRARGHTVGHTVSPHIYQINERAQINLKPLAETEYCQELSEFLDIIKPSGVLPSYFELLVAFAYWLFERRQVDYAVIEVGLGGLLDGTNVVKNPHKVCVITDIGLDHMKFLGNTVREIAAQKAGIIHPHNQVFMYNQAPEIVQTVQGIVRDKEAELHTVSDASYSSLTKSLPLFQQRNWFLANQVVDYVLWRDDETGLSESEQRTTVETYIPGRMEALPYQDKIIILDGAHNEQKVGALVQSLRRRYPDEPMAIIASFGENKMPSIQGALRLLREVSSNIILAEFSKGQDEVRRAVSADELALQAGEAGFIEIAKVAEPAKALAILLKRPEKILLVTGSFHLLQPIRAAYDAMQQSSPDDKNT